MTMSGPPGSEARSHPRRRLVTFAWYKRIDDYAMDEEEGVAQSCDVSQGGLGIVTSRPIPARSRVLIELVTEGYRLCVVGSVAFCTSLGDERYRLGVKMSFVPPTQRANWRKLCEP